MALQNPVTVLDSGDKREIILWPVDMNFRDLGRRQLVIPAKGTCCIYRARDIFHSGVIVGRVPCNFKMSALGGLGWGGGFPF